MRKIQRRDFLKAMGLTTAALGLTACGGSGAASASSVSSAPASSSSVPSASAPPEAAEDKAAPAGPPVTQFQTGELTIGEYTFKAQYIPFDVRREVCGAYHAIHADTYRGNYFFSCGGEIVGDDTMAASACPFCGNPIVLTGQFAGALRPDLIIPFKLDKKAAKAKLQEHLKGKTLLPRVFRSQNHIDEIKGVYVPFWLFDSDADAQLRFTATRTRSWSDSKYDYTETNYYSVRRDGTLGFDAVPVDGSSKIEDDLMESIEPFAMQDAIPFQTAYLAGYVADKYDVSAEDSIERANKRIRRSTEETFQQTVTGYDSVKVDNSSIQLHGGKAKYALFPVWLLSTSWRGENYLFAMNGQSGKFVGDLPVDKGAARKWMLGLTAALSAASYGVMWLLWLARIL